MNLEKYNLKAETTLTRFEFISEGPKGAIRKLIEFQATTDPGLFNLSFVDKNGHTGEIDDLSISDNGDTNKVLATIVSAVYAFLINIQRFMFTLRVVQKHERGFIEWAFQDFTTKWRKIFMCMGKLAIISLRLKQESNTMGF